MAMIIKTITLRECSSMTVNTWIFAEILVISFVSPRWSADVALEDYLVPIRRQAFI